MHTNVATVDRRTPPVEQASRGAVPPVERNREFTELITNLIRRGHNQTQPEPNDAKPDAPATPRPREHDPGDNNGRGIEHRRMILPEQAALDAPASRIKSALRPHEPKSRPDCQGKQTCCPAAAPANEAQPSEPPQESPSLPRSESRNVESGAMSDDSAPATADAPMEQTPSESSSPPAPTQIPSGLLTLPVVASAQQSHAATESTVEIGVAPIASLESAPIQTNMTNPGSANNAAPVIATAETARSAQAAPVQNQAENSAPTAVAAPPPKPSASPAQTEATPPESATQSAAAPEEPAAAPPRAATQPSETLRHKDRPDATLHVDVASTRADGELVKSPQPVAASQEALERLMVTNAVASDKDREQPIIRSDAPGIERVEPLDDKPAISPAAAPRHLAQSHQVDTAATRASGSVPAQLVQPVVRAVRNGADRIEIHLSPAELGRVDVKLDIAPDGRIQAVFAVDRPQTADLLQRDVRELARALQDAGLQTDTGSLSFNLRNQNQGHAHGWMANASNHPGPLADRVEPERTVQYRPMIVSDDQVDIHV